MGMVKRSARFLDMCARIRPPPALEQRSKGQEQLCDGEEKQRRTPESSGQNTGLRHKCHTRGSVAGSWFQSQRSLLDVAL